MVYQFKAPWELKLKLMTAGVLVLLGGLAYWKPSPITNFIVWGTILLCGVFGVYGYSIQDRKLIIMRMGWSKHIDLSDISNIEFKPHAMSGSIRTWGIGGLFGYIGYFHNSELGSYKAYATKGANSVILEVADQRIVVTPDHPQFFVKALREAVAMNRFSGKSQS